MLAFEDPLSAPYTRRIPDRQLDESWQLIRPDGMRLMRGEGGVALLEEMRLTRFLGRLCRMLRLTWVIDLVDRIIYRWKPRLSSIVPDVTGPRRPPVSPSRADNVPVAPR